ncbi:macrophage mannose receptor 1-like [Amphiura filiformis]|uniref:macrophage mannose receptor 1-like n=1 Tax=Amphiura filiformis TaxID=82378 RepID=UPI003B2122C0
MVYSIPENLRIEVQVGDKFGWASTDGVLARGYLPGGGHVRRKHVRDVSSLAVNNSYVLNGYDKDYTYAINTTVECFGEGSCSLGWDAAGYVHTDIHVLPEKYISCNGRITEWNFYPRAAANLIAIIWRHVSEDSFKVVGINTIDIPEDQIHEPFSYDVPEISRIEVQAGDMIGWAADYGFLRCNYDGTSGTRVRWSSLVHNLSLEVNATYTMNQAIRKHRCVIHATVEPYEATCDDSWNLFGYYCYKPSNSNKSFSDAEIMCQDEGAHLASIHNHGEQKFIMDIMENSWHFWIGLTDRLIEGTFVWKDNSSQVNFTKWHPSQPNDHKNTREEADCVDVWDTGNWFDETCDKLRKYICKKNALRNLTII